MSQSSCPFSHNHLTPLRASAETSFTPQSSLWQQVPLALTAWLPSNQHLLGFIPLSSHPRFHLTPPSFPSPPSFSIILTLKLGCSFCSVHFLPARIYRFSTMMSDSIFQCCLCRFYTNVSLRCSCYPLHTHLCFPISSFSDLCASYSKVGLIYIATQPQTVLQYLCLLCIYIILWRTECWRMCAGLCVNGMPPWIMRKLRHLLLLWQPNTTKRPTISSS